MSENMFRELTQKEIIQVYEQHLLRDFPPEEWKPLKQILNLVKEGSYQVYGFYEEDTLNAYAFLCSMKDEMFLDFFAVVASAGDRCQGGQSRNGEAEFSRGQVYGRGRGYCSRALETLLQHIAERKKEVLILEVEDPEQAETRESFLLRNRRIQFYRRAGMDASSVYGQVMGVDFRILYYNLGKQQITDGEISELLQAFYSKLYPQGDWSITKKRPLS